MHEHQINLSIDNRIGKILPAYTNTINDHRVNNSDNNSCMPDKISKKME